MEPAPTSGLAVEPHPPVHESDEFRGNGQAQPGAAVFACDRSVGLGKRLEDHPLFLARNSDARVGHAEMQAQLSGDRRRGFVLGPADGDGHFAVLGELDGIADEVDHHLA